MLGAVVQPRRRPPPVGAIPGRNMRNNRAPLLCLLAAWFIVIAATTASGLELKPEQVLILANREMPKSVDLARYYMKRRGIPEQNLIVTSTTVQETISRDDYEDEIAGPVRKYVGKHDPTASRFVCLVLMYGIPLRVGPPPLSSSEQKLLNELVDARSRLSQKEKALGKLDPNAKAVRDELAGLDRQIRGANRSSWAASVDSELALAMNPSYSLEGWLPNRYFVGFRGRQIANAPQRILATSRLDGPTEATVRRIIDDAIDVEAKGLSGVAYFDARMAAPQEGSSAAKRSATQIYDAAIHHTARLVESSKRLPVKVDSEGAVFPAGSAPNAALYCGWYSYANYVDAFTWAKGAIGFHVASAECTTLKSAGSNVWCKRMLEKGVVATLGPVTEPYLESFPQPEVFFGCLLSGMSLSQAYVTSTPCWSWQMVLIGDPLYRPFKSAASAPR